jgi:hypothetical protein
MLSVKPFFILSLYLASNSLVWGQSSVRDEVLRALDNNTTHSQQPSLKRMARTQVCEELNRKVGGRMQLSEFVKLNECSYEAVCRLTKVYPTLNSIHREVYNCSTPLEPRLEYSFTVTYRKERISGSVNQFATEVVDSDMLTPIYVFGVPAKN